MYGVYRGPWAAIELKNVIALADMLSVGLERCMTGVSSLLWNTQAGNKHTPLQVLFFSSIGASLEKPWLLPKYLWLEIWKKLSDTSLFTDPLLLHIIWDYISVISVFLFAWRVYMDWVCMRFLIHLQIGKIPSFHKLKDLFFFICLYHFFYKINVGWSSVAPLWQPVVCYGSGGNCETSMAIIAGLVV